MNLESAARLVPSAEAQERDGADRRSAPWPGVTIETHTETETM